MDLDDEFQDFLKERSEILKDIEQFLFMTLRYFSDMEKNDYDPKFFATETVGSLIKSLCLIHGLYGYPELNSSANDINVNKDAVRWIVLNNIKENGKAFVDFYKKANEDKVWQFRLEDITSSLREPAHIFLQLVRDLFGDIDEAANVGRTYLADLPDINFLKPVIWAEHKDKPECCGVSLGVRTFVRPLFLYIKLTQLRNVENGHNGVNLKDVKAFGSALERYSLLTQNPPSNKKSEYNNAQHPCESCQVFFSRYELTLINFLNNPSFPPFGNCAEYDVIRTNNLDSVLRDLAKSTEHWALFESACQHHFKAFNELTAILDAAGDEEAGDPRSGDPQSGDPPSGDPQSGGSWRSTIETYYKSINNAKVLRYRKFGQASNPQFKLVASNWPPPERRQATKKKRRITVQ